MVPLYLFNPCSVRYCCTQGNVEAWLVRVPLFAFTRAWAKVPNGPYLTKYGILKRDGIALMQTDHAALCMKPENLLSKATSMITLYVSENQ